MIRLIGTSLIHVFQMKFWISCDSVSYSFIMRSKKLSTFLFLWWIFSISVSTNTGQSRHHPIEISYLLLHNTEVHVTSEDLSFYCFLFHHVKRQTRSERRSVGTSLSTEVFHHSDTQKDSYHRQRYELDFCAVLAAVLCCARCCAVLYCARYSLMFARYTFRCSLLLCVVVCAELSFFFETAELFGIHVVTSLFPRGSIRKNVSIHFRACLMIMFPPSPFSELLLVACVGNLLMGRLPYLRAGRLIFDDSLLVRHPTSPISCNLSSWFFHPPHTQTSDGD